MKPKAHPLRRSTCGLSLLELLIAMSIFSLVASLLIAALATTQETWARTRERIGQFREARTAFEIAGQRISAATVNPYWGYDDPEAPTEYQRQSELHFVTGPSEILLGSDPLSPGHSLFFQAPFGFGGSDAGSLGGGEIYDGIENGMNAWGYYVEFNSDADEDYNMRPEFLNQGPAERKERARFRLMEFRLPSEKLTLFEQDEKGRPLFPNFSDKERIYEWFADSDRRKLNSYPVAENILVFGIRPRVPGLSPNEFSIAPAYHYDSRLFQWRKESSELTRTSRHQIPPVVDLFVVALEEPSFARYYDREGIAAVEALAEFVRQRFRKAELLEQDLEEVENHLNGLGIQNRVFQTSIAIRAGKWHSD